MQMLDDLSLLEREDLIRMGQSAIRNQKTETAMNIFGAAIRRAEHSDTLDLEAELYKLMILYINGDFDAAKQRCILCLDVIYRLNTTYEIPIENLKHTHWLLERMLIELMKKQDVGFFALFKHLFYLHKGESYKLKKTIGLFQALRQANILMNSNLNVVLKMIPMEEVKLVNDKMGFKDASVLAEPPVEAYSEGESSSIEWTPFQITSYPEWDDDLKGRFTVVLETIKYPDQFQKCAPILERIPVSEKPIFFSALSNNKYFPKEHHDRLTQHLIDDVNLLNLERNIG